MIVKLNPEKAARSAPLYGLAKEDFGHCFNKKPFMIAHSLQQHSLFDLENLLQLAKELPVESVEYDSGDLPVSQNPTRTLHNGLTVQEAFHRIEKNKSGLVLKNVEQINEYGQLLDECLNQLQEFVDPVAPGMRKREGFIFISSPDSITPYQIDPDSKFLLQVRGNKFVHMFDPTDRDVIGEQQIEEFLAGTHRDLKMDSKYEDRGYRFELNPGQGLHFPFVAPHLAKNDSELSISFIIAFQTDDSVNRQSLHRFNRQLRKIGISPKPVGQSAWRDKTKMCLINALKPLKNFRGVTK